MSDNFFQHLFKNPQLWSISSDKTDQGGFANACGQQQGNMSSYLRCESLKNRVMTSVAKRLFELRINPVIEMEGFPLPRDKWKRISVNIGIYVLYDSGCNVLYIGKSNRNLCAEVEQTITRNIPDRIRFGPTMKKVRPKFESLVAKISIYEVNSKRSCDNLEALLLRTFINHTHNSNKGNFK